MRLLVKFIVFGMLFCYAGQVFSQDFFVEEKDSVSDFYANNRRVAIVGLADPINDFYGGAIWIHHRKARFSTYLECKYNNTSSATISAINHSGTSRMSVSATQQILVLGSGVGSTIYENYLWYANLGLRSVTSAVARKPIPDHKLIPQNPFSIHYGAGLAAVFANRVHVQIGIDFESFYINAGAGLVF